MRSKVFATLALSAVALFSFGSPAMADGKGHTPVAVCHQEGNGSYNPIDPDNASGHYKHDGDIFGPYVDKKGVSHAGQNLGPIPGLGATGADILKAGCEVPKPPTGPDQFHTCADGSVISVKLVCPPIKNEHSGEQGNTGPKNPPSSAPVVPAKPKAAPPVGYVPSTAPVTTEAPTVPSDEPTATPVADKLADTGADAPWIMPVGLAALAALALGVALQIFSKRARRH